MAQNVLKIAHLMAMIYISMKSTPSVYYPDLLRSRYENATPNLCWLINKGGFFEVSFVVVVDRHLPRFEALAYVLPHFDELTHVMIRA